MVQRRERLRLALEPGATIGIVRESLRQHLDGNLPFERRVGRTVDLFL
jgi:hypothetical protein